MSEIGENDERLDQDSDFCDQWRDEINDYRKDNPNDKRTDYEIASELEKDYNDTMDDYRII